MAKFRRYLTETKKEPAAKKEQLTKKEPPVLDRIRIRNNLNNLKKIITGKGKWPKIIISFVLLVILFSIFFPLIFKKGLPDEGLDLTSDKITDDAIETQVVSLKEVSDGLNILGQIVFREKVNMSSKVKGRLSRIYVKEGDRVAPGQVIAEIERLPLQITLNQQISDLDIAKKSYDLTRAKYENALKGIDIKLKTIEKAEADLIDKKVSYENMDRILKNKRALYEVGGLSESEVKSLAAQHTTVYTKYELAKKDLDIQNVGYRDEDILEEGHKVPKNKKERTSLIKKINTKIEKAELEAAKSRISQAEENIKATKILLAETYIRSPITGMVASKNMEAGEMVKEESTIAVILNIASVFMAMNVNEKDYKKIKSGQTVEFTVDAIGEEVFKAQIKRITPVLDMKTRTVEVKAELGNPGYRLLPGMFARARIETSAKEKKLTVPKSALLKKDGSKAELYVVKKGIALKQSVTLGAEYTSDYEIVRGLSEGDTIISKGVNIVFPEMKVGVGKKTANAGHDRKAGK